MADRGNPQRKPSKPIKPSLAVDLSRNRDETFKAHGKSASVGEVLDTIWHMYRAHGAPLKKFHAKNFVPARCKPCFPRLPAH